MTQSTVSRPAARPPPRPGIALSLPQPHPPQSLTEVLPRRQPLADLYPLIPLLELFDKPDDTVHKNGHTPLDLPGTMSPAALGLIPIHDLIRMANALGIAIDYSTLRFWHKRWLVPKPVWSNRSLFAGRHKR